MSGYALVKLGAVASSLSPSFGQATTAADLLVAWLFTNDGAATDPFGTSSPGWAQATPGGGGAFEWVSVWYKPDCAAGETAPVFTDTGGGSGPLSMLGEFSGGALTSPLDSYGTSTGSSSVQTVANAASDAAGGDLIIYCAVWNGGNTGGAITNSMTDSGGHAVTVNATDNSGAGGGVTVFYDFCWGIAGATGASKDTATGTLSVFSGGGSVIASFLAAAVGPSFTAPPNRPRGQAVNRASTY